MPVRHQDIALAMTNHNSKIMLGFSIMRGALERSMRIKWVKNVRIKGDYLIFTGIVGSGRQMFTPITRRER